MTKTELSQEDLVYFRRGIVENPRFWSRFGGKPSFEGAEVLDVGCGHGSLCLDIAQSGAAQVVGLDLNGRLIEFANENLRQNFPEWRDRVSFLNQDLQDYPLEPFDYIVSKDSFEHILDLAGMLAEMKKRLNPRGRIYAGFGPLYNSPFGDHGTAKLPLPWGHLLIGDERLIRRVNQRRREKVSSIHDLGLNRLAFADYQRIFAESGLEIVYFETNCSTKTLSKVLSVARRAPFLEEYCIHNIYCILENQDDDQDAHRR